MLILASLLTVRDRETTSKVEAVFDCADALVGVLSSG
jgi:hypothetical protein